MAKKSGISIYMSYLLRHHPEDINLSMDVHGWVDVQELIDGINKNGKYEITREKLEQIVAEDSKGRYRFNEDGSRIKACQGHSIPWVIPELEYKEPPEFLYHGTTTYAWEKIKNSGFILKMERHAVHMQASEEKAWPSALRWHQPAIVLKIVAKELAENGMEFGITENGVWCAEKIPVSAICEVLEERK